MNVRTSLSFAHCCLPVSSTSIELFGKRCGRNDEFGASRRDANPQRWRVGVSNWQQGRALSRAVHRYPSVPAQTRPPAANRRPSSSEPTSLTSKRTDRAARRGCFRSAGPAAFGMPAPTLGGCESLCRSQRVNERQTLATPIEDIKKQNMIYLSNLYLCMLSLSCIKCSSPRCVGGPARSRNRA